MQVSGERLPPRAVLTKQQHARIGGGHLSQLVAQLLHLPAFTDRLRHGSSQQPTGRATLASRLEPALHRAQQLGERQGLFHEIECAESSRLDRGLDGAVTRHHDDGAQCALRSRPLAQQGDAIDVGHPDVEQNQIRLLLDTQCPCLRRVGSHLDHVALVGQDFFDELADVRLVIDHQNACCTHARSLLNSARRSRPWDAFDSLRSGNITRTRAPPSGRFSASIEPP